MIRLGEQPNRNRRSIRLKGYDYSRSGAYFITIVARDRVCLFGGIVNTLMQLNDAGAMLTAEWIALPDRFPVVEMDAFVVMPNHLHGIIVIDTDQPKPADTPATRNTAHTPCNRPVGAPLVAAQYPGHATIPKASVGAPLVGAPPLVAAQSHADTTTRAATRAAPTIGNIIGAFKSITTDEYVRGVKTMAWLPFPGKLWQRNYYDHIIRNDTELYRIRRYILENPLHWARDRENPIRDSNEVAGT